MKMKLINSRSINKPVGKRLQPSTSPRRSLDPQGVAGFRFVHVQCFCLSQRGRPIAASVAGDIHGKFQPAPDSYLVKYAPQMVFDHLLAGTDDFTDLAVGQALPNQNGNLHFFRRKVFARGHDWGSSLEKIAVASFTRLRPSRIPARRNSVRRGCFTVRGLMLSCPAISLLLQPWISRFSTC